MEFLYNPRIDHMYIVIVTPHQNYSYYVRLLCLDYNNYTMDEIISSFDKIIDNIFLFKSIIFRKHVVLLFETRLHFILINKFYLDDIYNIK